MAQPQAYDRTVDFTQRDGDDTDHAGINAELDAAATSINGIRANLALIQKDDGGLANGIVTPDSLTPEVFEALTLDISEQVSDASASAQSALNSAISAAASASAAAASQVAANTSENASALNASGAATSAGAAQASQTAAAASAAAALVSQNAAASSASAASTSAGTATTQAGIATTQAGTATTQAGNAATSATTATTQAGIATTQAGTATTQAGTATTQAGNAATSATASAASAVAAAASAATVNLPAMVGKALNWLRVKADESGYEHRTAAQVRSDIGAAAAVDIGKNKIINGNFAINQRAYVSGAALGAGVYGFDRWKAGSGGCTLTFSTVNNVTTATITAGTLVQVIEGASLLSGNHVLSWTGTAQGRIDGGAYGASGAVTAAAVGGTNMTVEFGTGTVSLVQLETGSLSSAFEQRAYGQELALCQRYYQRFTGAIDSSICSIAVWSSTTNFGVLKLKTTMYAAPTFTSSRVAALTCLVNTAASVTTNIVLSIASPDVANLQITSTAALTTAGAGWCKLTAGTDWLAFSSEL